jgi:antitoxin (DNA-binding transcriptional repressor) of toxin-antitoxin stability system
MKRMTASEVRRRWFSVLDRVAGGEVVAVERNGRLVVLRREEPRTRAAVPPNYREVIRVPKADEADRWTWKWSAQDRALRLTNRSR